MNTAFNPFKQIIAIVLVSTLSGCAAQKLAESKVDKEIKEVIVQENTGAAQSARDFIMKSDKFSQNQKEKLLALQEKNHAQTLALKEEIEKTKMVLMQTVLDPKMNETEFAILKKKITKLEKQKLEAGFKTISEARSIIEPKKNLENKEHYKAFLLNHLQEF